jgi:OOP family OmpA-OmpF porin
MLNQKFGLKFEVANDMAESVNANLFKSNIFHVNVVGVVNVGQALDFQKFTNRFSLLLNVGLGYSNLTIDEALATDSFVNDNNGDGMVNAKVGLTLQTRITDKLAFNVDASQRYMGHRKLNLDGSSFNESSLTRNDAGILNLTAGLTYYLGKNKRHSDWKPFVVIPDLTNELEVLQKKLAEVENTAVSKSDLDILKKEMDSKVNSIASASQKVAEALNSSSKDIPAHLMNNDYMTAYFDFNKRTQTNISTSGIDFLVTYLRKNPNAKVTLIGYADEIGKSTYNDKLSNDRAESVKRVIMKAGITEDRIMIKAGGVDGSVEPSSAEARTLVRRVVFRVN